MKRAVYVIGVWIGIVCGTSQANAQDTLELAPVAVHVAAKKLTASSRAPEQRVKDGPVSLTVTCTANGGADCSNLQAWLVVDSLAARNPLAAVSRAADRVRWVFAGKSVASN